MLERSPKNLDRSPKGHEPKELTERRSQMYDVATAQNLMQEAFSKNGEPIKSSIWNAYRKLKLRSERRARAIWHGEVKRIDAHEMEALERAALERAQDEYIKAKYRIETLKAALRQTDKDFYFNQIDEFGD